MPIALDRSSRVEVDSYVCADTVEERIRTILARNRRMFGDVIEGASLHELHRRGISDLMPALTNNC